MINEFLETDHVIRETFNKRIRQTNTDIDTLSTELSKNTNSISQINTKLDKISDAIALPPQVVEYYVNPATGKDGEGYGLSENKPFKTIKAAITALPYHLAGREYKIKLADATYNENIGLFNLRGGKIVIHGSSIYNSIINRGIYLQNCSAVIYIRVLTFLDSYANNATIHINQCRDVYMSDFRCPKNPHGYVNNLFYIKDSLVKIRDVDANYMKTIVDAYDGAMVFCHNITGSANLLAFSAGNSTTPPARIAKSNCTISANTMHSIRTGSVIHG